MIQGVLAGIIFALLIWWFGLPLSAGAHPFWAEKVIWIGAPIGMVAFFVTKVLAPMRQAIVAAIILTLAGVAAFQGKAIFAASYGENGLAGQAWFIGWITTCAALTLLIAAIARWFSTR